MKENKIYIFSDGACKGNPGPGGWGVLLKYQGHIKELFGGEENTTNNRMELMAVIQGLNALNRSCHIELYTDSQYVKNGITQWMENWKTNHWKTANKKEVKNQDLWKQLDEEVKKHYIHWYWVKGHSGHPENERADQLANQGVAQYLSS